VPYLLLAVRKVECFVTYDQSHIFDVPLGPEIWVKAIRHSECRRLYVPRNCEAIIKLPINKKAQ
jgi:hypothetical protein